MHLILIQEKNLENYTNQSLVFDPIYREEIQSYLTHYLKQEMAPHEILDTLQTKHPQFETQSKRADAKGFTVYYPKNQETDILEKHIRNVLKWRTPTKHYTSLIERFHHTGTNNYDRVLAAIRNSITYETYPSIHAFLEKG